MLSNSEQQIKEGRMFKNSTYLHKVRARIPRLASSTLLVLALLASTLAVPAFSQDDPVEQEVIGEIVEQQFEPRILSETRVGDAINTVVELSVAQDAYITSNQPTTNWGGSNFLRLGYNLASPTNYGALRVFLKFNLSSIPRQAIINSARFRIYMHTATPTGDQSMGVETRHLVSDWSEYSVTWNSHQPDWGGVIGTSWVPSTIGWREGDVTALVRDWVSGQHANNGVTFMADERVQERQRIFYSKEAGNGLHPRLIVDYTYSPDTTPPTASVNPLPQWSQDAFNVTWDGSDNPGGSGIAYFDVQYNTNAGTWLNWKMHTTSKSAEFRGGANGVLYQFRARAVDNAGNVQSWSGSQAQTTVDTVPPSVTVEALPQYTFSQSAIIRWGGSDNAGGSGIATYDVQWREQGGAWQTLVSNTTTTSFQATGGKNGVTYEFRARGTDRAGNVQPWSEYPQAATTVVLHPVSTVLPFSPPILRHTDPVTDSFTVEWAGITAPGTSIAAYEVRYRFNEGTWQTWLPATTKTSETFVIPIPSGTTIHPDGVFQFEVAATNSIGQKEGFTGMPEAGIAIDRLPPYITPIFYMPMVTKGSD
jgi:hypothetical protein